MNTEILGFIAGGITSVAMVPQVIKVIREKKAENISAVMVSVLLVGVGLWTWYGFLEDDLPIILSNGFSFLVNALLLILKIIFGNNSKS